MSVRKVAAHPLVVAVAFGLLGPEMLEPLPMSSDDADISSCEEDGLLPEITSVDPEEFARVEREWQAARDLTV